MIESGKRYVRKRNQKRQCEMQKYRKCLKLIWSKVVNKLKPQ